MKCKDLNVETQVELMELFNQSHGKHRSLKGHTNAHLNYYTVYNLPLLCQYSPETVDIWEAREKETISKQASDMLVRTNNFLIGSFIERIIF